MLVLLTHAVTLLVGFFVLALVVHWVTKLGAFWRNSLAFSLCLVSAYSVSFLIEMIRLAAIGTISVASVVLPAITWLIIAIVTGFLSIELRANKWAMAVPYFLVGSAATFAGVAVHSYNLWIGIPVLALGFLSAATPARTDGGAKQFLSLGDHSW